VKTVQIEHMDEDTWRHIKASAALHGLTIPRYLKHLQGYHDATCPKRSREVKK